MKLAPVAVVVALTAVNCSTASERALLDQFFVASRLRDRTALARFATVVFEPLTDGIVAEFIVQVVTPEREVAARPAPDRPAVPASERERAISLSLADPTDPVDWTSLPTVLVEKDVTVSARLGRADGTETTQSIVVTLRRARVIDGAARSGRWIVVRFVY
jgi:hypothetical protein